MIRLNITDEISPLDSVILGISEEMAGPGKMDPKSRFHTEHDSFPTQDDVAKEVDSLLTTLIRHGVKVYRPQNIRNLTQLFVRDLGFVIGDTFFVGNLVEERLPELEGIRYLIDQFDPAKVINLNEHEGVDIEGGDIVLMGDRIFVGLSDRTNHNGYLFLKEMYAGKREVVQLELIVNKEDHTEHSLHLDCSFQPLGKDYAIVYEDGIKNPEALYNSLDLPEENIFKADKWQFVRMFPNIVSLSTDTVMIEKEFIELKYWLLDRGFNVEEVHYRQISKLSGLMRCSTLPLVRR
jgi:N-dimethylarginine dimethylaminohydrolase